MLEITKVNTEEHFFSLKNNWNEILSMSMQHSIFMTWEWLYTWWETYSKGKELCILLFCEDNGHLVGIAPFYITCEKVLGISIRILKLIGSEEVCSEYLDVIAKKDKTIEVTKE